MNRLKKAYAAFGRLSHKVAVPFLRLYMSPDHVRVRVLILSEENEVLLVRSWFSHQKWSLPGGGVGRGEPLEAAAAREVHEETGLRIAADHLTPLGTFPNESTQKYTYTVACFAITIARREPQIAARRTPEMLDAAWFKLDALPKPKDLSPTVAQALELERRA